MADTPQTTRRGASCVAWLALLLVLTLGVVVVVDLAMRRRDEARSRDRVRMARTLTTGRPRADVVGLMGETPHVSPVDEYLGEKREGWSMLVYKSSIPGESVQGCEDVYVVLDANDIVVTAYYPDSPAERQAMEAALGRGRASPE